MTSRSIITIGFFALCGAALWGVLAQGRQVSELQAEQKRQESARPTTNDSAADTIVSPTPEVPRELLQLRAEVARLTQQQRELASAQRENDRLRLQLENRRTNNTAANALATGYIRISESKWLGYSTPENTLQSFLWAIKNHDLGKYLEALTPDKANQTKEMLQNTSRAPEQLFGDKEMAPVYRIAKRQDSDPLAPGRFDHADLEIQIGPDMPTETFTFQQIEGQWKLQGFH
jgi:hypothetical protein